MFFDGRQLAASILVALRRVGGDGAMVFAREGDRREARRWGVGDPRRCARCSRSSSWTRFGEVHSRLRRQEPRRPLRSGRRPRSTSRSTSTSFSTTTSASKYFKEIGYESLYDCVTDADHEIAKEDGRQPRITGYIRNLNDVLVDKTIEEAIAHCEGDRRQRFTDARWLAFKSDMRELHRIVPDDWWGGAVYDAGFNPPPSGSSARRSRT